MLHVATPHVGSRDWIEIQRERFARHTTEPYRMYAILDSEEGAEAFDWAGVADEAERREAGPTLNRLGEVILAEADPGDLILFTHGDAFPIADGWNETARGWLADNPLVAVQRIENAGDPHAHDCFCLTTAGFWRELGGDWRAGPTWPSGVGLEVTDTGATLWRQLTDADIHWHRVLRSSRHDLHPMFFSVYGGIYYHHGAGFRAAMSRADAAEFAGLWPPYASLRRRLRRARNGRLSARIHGRIASGEEVFSELS